MHLEKRLPPNYTVAVRSLQMLKTTDGRTLRSPSLLSLKGRGLLLKGASVERETGNDGGGAERERKAELLKRPTKLLLTVCELRARISVSRVSDPQQIILH